MPANFERHPPSEGWVVEGRWIAGNLSLGPKDRAAISIFEMDNTLELPWWPLLLASLRLLERVTGALTGIALVTLALPQSEGAVRCLGTVSSTIWRRLPEMGT
jgi:hypothetical protein